MSADLRIPLSALPGFDPRGLFCVDVDQPDNCVLEVVNDWVRFAGDDFPDTSSGSVFLDLSNAATRDRLARWVAYRVGLEIGCTSPQWACGASHDGEQGWTLWGCGDEYWFSCEDEASPLHSLDPFDDETLPDGSQRIDAIALGRMAVHVGSRP